jgi:hypothetical protein
MFTAIVLFMTGLSASVLCGAHNTPIKELLRYEPALITISNQFPEPLIIDIDATGFNNTEPKTDLAYPQVPEKKSYTIPPNTNSSLRFWKLIHTTPQGRSVLSSLWICVRHSPPKSSKASEDKTEDYCGAGAYFEVELANPPRHIVACKDEQRLKVYQEY